MMNNHTTTTTTNLSTTSTTPLHVLTTEESLITDIQASVGELFFISLSMSVMSGLTVIGNIFVLIVYAKERRLQTPNNLFILSLAVADIIIALIPVNLYTVYLMYSSWPLGPYICNAWLVIDYWACTVSTLTLLAIAFDRFYFTWFPVRYRLKSSRRYVWKVVVGIWISAFLIWGPAIVIYPFAHGKQTVPSDQCYIQFLLENGYITFVTAFCSYYGPVLMTTILYAALSLKLVKMNNRKKQRVVPAIPSIGHNDAHPQSRNTEVKEDIIQNRHINATRRSLKLLLLIISAFAVSWLPYYLSTVVVSITKIRLPERLWRFCYIVGWGNSCLNPLCYAYGSRHFRKGFHNLIIACLRRKRKIGSESVQRRLHSVSVCSKSQAAVQMSSCS